MIKSRFARRKALNIRRSEEDEGENSVEHSFDQADDQDDGPVVKRPLLTPRGSNRVKKSSSLRLSFGPGGSPGTEEASENGGGEEFTPKKSRLSREALERSAAASHSSLPRSTALPLRGAPDVDRPSYSKEYVNELRSATPSAPRSPKLGVTTIDDDGSTTATAAVDVVAKFGVHAASRTKTTSAIPSEAEIREKKERRSRLAREQEYIGLDDEDDGDNDDGRDEDDEDDDYQLTLRPRPSSTKWQETRLVHEDEDLGEGFDEFVEDGSKILLGKQAELKQKQQQRETMRQMIDEAEGGGHRRRRRRRRRHSDNDSLEDDEVEDDREGESTSESEVERRAVYEEAQTRAGTNRSTSASHATQRRRQLQRPTTPPRITPIPTLEQCISRLESTLRDMQQRRQQKIDQLQEMARRKVEVIARQAEIQKLLEEASTRYERLRAEAGLPVVDGMQSDRNGRAVHVPLERGLESLGTMQTGSLMDQD